ncbi:MAG TPA: hypothetical protein VEY30_01715, partial [Myxococcaceae bacterium]|nr:hypothetical protein [Myxococcaceae bacterium]
MHVRLTGWTLATVLAAGGVGCQRQQEGSGQASFQKQVGAAQDRSEKALEQAQKAQAQARGEQKEASQAQADVTEQRQ